MKTRIGLLFLAAGMAFACTDQATKDLQPDLTGVDPLIAELRMKKNFQTIEVPFTPDMAKNSVYIEDFLKSLKEKKKGATMNVAADFKFLDKGSNGSSWTSSERFHVDIQKGLVINALSSIAHAVTGIGARSQDSGLQELWLEVRPINADGTLGSATLLRTSQNASVTPESMVSIPYDPVNPRVAIGWGFRNHSNAIRTIQVYSAPWLSSTKSLGIVSANDVNIYTHTTGSIDSSGGIEMSYRAFDFYSGYYALQKSIISGIGGRVNNGNVTRIGIFAVQLQ
jgi:hypothetical protein